MLPKAADASVVFAVRVLTSAVTSWLANPAAEVPVIVAPAPPTVCRLVSRLWTLLRSCPLTVQVLVPFARLYASSCPVTLSPAKLPLSLCFTLSVSTRFASVTVTPPSLPIVHSIC